MLQNQRQWEQGQQSMQAGEPNGTAQQTPFGTAAIQASKLPGQGRPRGASADGVGTAVSIIDDPKHRALHTVNPEILEIASHDDVSIVEPPTKVNPDLHFCISMPHLFQMFVDKVEARY